MTTAEVRLKTLVACGWNEKLAKRYIKKHPRPHYMVEHIAILNYTIRKFFNNLVRSVEAEFVNNRENRKKIFRR